MAQHPYAGGASRSFWRSAVTEVTPWEMESLWTPRIAFSAEDRFATYGSCFAQNIGRALVASGYRWVDAEPAPPRLEPAIAARFSYKVFSARTQNIYSTPLLDQWLSWALDDVPVPDEVWVEDGRYFDPFRPTVEPNGFASMDELQAARAATLAAIKSSVRQCSVFVFTLGLTESWINGDHGYTYANCPGTAHGTFDPAIHRFVNLDYSQARASLESAVERIRRAKPEVRFLFTVSPVPLTATASTEHVVTATSYSKSVLRAVAGDVVNAIPNTEYFPSYEYFTSTPFRAALFDANQRTASKFGVEFALSRFMSVLPARGVAPEPSDDEEESDDVSCEEAMLEAFAPGA